MLRTVGERQNSLAYKTVLFQTIQFSVYSLVLFNQ